MFFPNQELQHVRVLMWTFVLANFLAFISCQKFVHANELPVPLVTRWAKQVSPDNVLPEYPRPQLMREQWWNLNGEWEYAIRPEDEEVPPSFDGKILVPFPVESYLSGVAKRVSPQERLWYRRVFDAPPHQDGERVLLNFGAIDWHAIVWLNGVRIDEHHGGYEPFSFDITDELKEGNNELVVSVWDPTDAGVQPRGKQVGRPHGIWYTAVTGIWQTVWLEVVPESYITALRMVPHAESGSIDIEVTTSNDGAEEVTLTVREQGEVVVTSKAKANTNLTVEIPNAKTWSPDQPNLYDLEIVSSGGDRVTSYFGLRDIAVGKDENGINRLMLNGEPLFQYGLLDQGWWPDGLYTAPTDEALRYDLEITKQLGFNMVRKHVKVEPARWYYWCDKMGLLVWQDMPSGDKYIGGKDPDITRTEESGENFENELHAMVEFLFNHPSIVMWVPYNEGWGQWQTEHITSMLEQLDPSRLVNNASGWNDRGVGDVHDIHVYPGPAMPPLEENRAAVLGEFGGLGLALPGHLWQEDRNWGYRSYADEKELADAYRQLLIRLHFLVDKGLSAAVYTQTTDVEIEVNGILTYDREVLKLPEEFAQHHARLYGPAPMLQSVVPTSEEQPHAWQYTFSRPADDWHSPQFDDSAWETGEAGFGANDPPNVAPRTPWEGNQIWLRRTVEIPVDKVSQPMLRIYHDEDAEVYLNGIKVATLSGYSTNYELYEIDPETWSQIGGGNVTIAIHCRQTLGGQYIDAGIYDLVPSE